MSEYARGNLVKYDEAIELLFDTSYQIAWLTLRNYGYVFHKWSWANPLTAPQNVTIGIPAGSFSNTEAERLAIRRREPGAPRPRAEEVLNAKPSDGARFSISARLDVIQVIKFQTTILEIVGKYSQGGHAWEGDSVVDHRSGYTREDLFAQLQLTFKAIGIADPAFGQTDPNPGKRPRTGSQGRDIRHRLTSTMTEESASPWIEDQIQKNALEDTGLTAYFPMPALIIQEQRTGFIKGTKTGATINQDMRLIKPVTGRLVNPSPQDRGHKVKGFLAEEFFAELDKDRENDEADFVNRPDREGFLKLKSFPNGVAYLHKNLDRINCYGFRGESRDPQTIHRANGLLPGVTRTDEGVAGYYASAILLNLAVRPPPKKDLDEYRRQGIEIGSERYIKIRVEAEIGRLQLAITYDELLKEEVNGHFTFGELVKFSYRDLIKNLNVLTLGVYTSDMAFKGFISVTTSIAIAKALAGKYASAKENSKYCYALRCTGGFHLPTDVQGKESKWNKKTDAQNALTHEAEQEVAVPGAIFWKDVCGMRLIRLDQAGPCFSGPVFMKDTLRSSWKTQEGKHPTWIRHDDGAFDEIFELLSGKSQGPGFRIDWSYPEAPFDCPTWLMEDRNRFSQ